MATVGFSPVTPTSTVGDVLIDDIPAGRILPFPTPGTATAADVGAVQQREGRLCELVNGTLVEKTMGAVESFLMIIYLAVS